ncbi:MAG TPA: arsenite methyltransferase [Spirochaetia bacterium]|nr:arsenite methyltransferase [Spirochaetia bacterium]
MKGKDMRETVRRHYGAIAGQGASCCGSKASCCGAGDEVSSSHSIGHSIGYSRQDMDSVPDGSNLGLGCGNPLAFASIKAGETVLDLGSGAGFDCFLAAQRVDRSGKVIGVDMTPEMVDKARENAERGGFYNVEFRLGEIEHLPVPDASVDLIISNCVINLSVNKTGVFQEAYRVLKPGGRLMISDIVLKGELPRGFLESAAAYVRCVAGASLRDEYLGLIDEAGFGKTEVLRETPYSLDLIIEDQHVQSLKAELRISDAEVMDIGSRIVSISVSAVKPE